MTSCCCFETVLLWLFGLSCSVYSPRDIFPSITLQCRIQHIRYLTALQALYKKKSQFKWTASKVLSINSVHSSMNNALLKVFLDMEHQLILLSVTYFKNVCFSWKCRNPSSCLQWMCWGWINFSYPVVLVWMKHVVNSCGCHAPVHISYYNMLI